MNHFVMLVGAPASGKSTWAEKMCRGYVIVSSDAIRGELYGDESIQGDPAKVFEIAHERILKAIENGQAVVFDATNMKYKNRMAIMRKLEKFIHLNKECHIFAEPYLVLMGRNEARKRKVPEDVIWRMIRGFEMPTRAEGYNRIVVHNTVSIKTEVVIDEAVGFDQCNHHHSLSLYEHCKTARDYIVEKVVTDNWNKLQNLADAAFFHDFGKLDTQTFFNAKGIETIEAHYYDHHGVGAYWALMYDEPWDELDRIYIAQLICYHMLPYLLKTEQAEKRWRERIGNQLYEDVLIIHEADVAAH